jgi:hypothetical protein
LNGIIGLSVRLTVPSGNIATTLPSSRHFSAAEIASLPFFLEDGVLDSEPYSQLKIIRTMNFKQLYYGAADAALKQMKLLTSGKISEFDNIILSAAEKKAAGKIITK